MTFDAWKLDFGDNIKVSVKVPNLDPPYENDDFLDATDTLDVDFMFGGIIDINFKSIAGVKGIPAG